MKLIKYIAHPFSYIVLFIIISFLARIPHPFSWRAESQPYIYNHFWIYIFYIIAFILGYEFIKIKKQNDEYKSITKRTLLLFHIVFAISLLFFIAKIIYVGGFPLFAGTMARSKMAGLGGFVDYPTKLVSLLGIASYFIFTRNKQKLFLVYIGISILMNFLFAERGLIVFTLLGVLIIFVTKNEISFKLFYRTLLIGVALILTISWIQMKRHGGQNNLDLSGKMSFLEVSFWIIAGDLSGSQKLGAYVIHKNNGKPLYGKYTLGMYLSTFIPNYTDHGAEYIQKNYTKARTAQSIAIPFSYYVDFKYFYVILPFILGIISKILYVRFRTLNNPFYVILYTAFFFELLWSIRSGIIPFSPKFIYFFLSLLFIFNLPTKNHLNQITILFSRFLFLLSLGLSFFMLLKRW